MTPPGLHELQSNGGMCTSQAAAPPWRGRGLIYNFWVRRVCCLELQWKHEWLPAFISDWLHCCLKVGIQTAWVLGRHVAWKGMPKLSEMTGMFSILFWVVRLSVCAVCPLNLGVFLACLEGSCVYWSYMCHEHSLTEPSELGIITPVLNWSTVANCSCAHCLFPYSLRAKNGF